MKYGRTCGGIMLGVVISALFTVHAVAADITVFLGGVKPGSLTIGSLSTSLDSGPIYGVRLSTSFVPMLGLEHTLAFSSDYLFPTTAAAITEAKGFVYNSNLIFNLPVRHTVPYATVGLGLIHQYGSPNLPVGTKFAFNYGGGLKFPRMFGPIGLRFDARGYTTASISTDHLNIFEVSGGILISF